MKPLTLILLCFFSPLPAQDSGWYMPHNFQRTYQQHIRTREGWPGSAWWQNRADYVMTLSFDPTTLILNGQETIAYTNHSPDVLSELVLHLFSNLYKKGALRDFHMDQEDEQPGLLIQSLRLNEKEIPRHRIHTASTQMSLPLDLPLLPGQTVSLSIKWQMTLPKKTHVRTGRVRDNTVFMAYFFPRVAVYDAVDGWNRFDYTGFPEFYNDFGDFDVTIDVPKGWVVRATGLLQNPHDVLNQPWLSRYQTALSSDSLIHIILPEEAGSKRITRGRRWRFKAENVTDFAFGVSDDYLWDGHSLMVDDQTGRRVFIDAFYDESSGDFYQVAHIARQAIDLMSRELPGIPFPYPKITVFNGLDEMEYPMMVNDLSLLSKYETVKLTTHEIFHTYFPFFTGLNETKYAWMDEGLTSFYDYQIAARLDSSGRRRLYGMGSYQNVIGHDFDMPIFSSSKYLRETVYWWNSYFKSATFWFILQDYLGQEQFQTIIREFVARWQGKHPIPHDLFFTFENVTGEDLSWLFSPWFFEFGFVDLGIKDVTAEGVVIQRMGHYPAGFTLKITRESGETASHHFTAAVWKEGRRQFIAKIEKARTIRRADLLFRFDIDADSGNDRWVQNR